MTRTTIVKPTSSRATQLALRGVDTSSDDGVMLRFAAGGEEFVWRFKAATFDELVALALGGRLGAGKDVHFDAAKVSFKDGSEGRPGSVRIAIGRKVRIVAPAPARGKATAKRVGAGRKTPIA